MKKIICLLFLFLVGCATTANYEKILNSWIGASEIDLVRTWGPADNQFNSSGIKFISYQKNGAVYIPGTSPTYTTTMIGNTAYTTTSGGSPGYNIHLNCKTTFEIKDERVINWRWEGNGCKSK